MCKAHRLVYHSTLGSRVIKKKKKHHEPSDGQQLALCWLADLGIGGCAATPLPYTNRGLRHGEKSLLPVAGGGLERARDARPGMGEAILRVPQLAARRVRRGLGWVGVKKQWIHLRGLG